MKKGSSKRKGSSFERLIAKQLSLWISDNKRTDIFWRTHSSGQLGTKSKMRLEYGDILAIDDLGKDFINKYNIECRCGKIIKIADLIYKKGNIQKFIDEGYKNAVASGRSPIWIFKEHQKPILIMFEFKENKYKGNYMTLLNKKLAIMLFTNWRKEISPNNYGKIIK